MKPVFITRGVCDTGWSKIVKEAHIKFSVCNKNRLKFDGIGFGMAEKFELVKGGPFDIVYQVDENEWNGEKRLQLIVKDVRKCENSVI